MIRAITFYLGAHKFMKTKKIPFDKYSWDTFASEQSQIYFDLYGCLFMKIKKMVFEGKQDALIHFLLKLFKVIFC